MGDRCTGACCRRFLLPVGPNELKADPGHWQDGYIVADMVIFLEVSNRHADGSIGPEHFWYTCRHFDQESGDCRIYEQRPRMCRDYPYGVPCIYTGCQWDAGRAGEWPLKLYPLKIRAKVDKLEEDLKGIIASRSR